MTNKYTELYSDDDLNKMRIAEKSRLPGKNRIEEIKNFARLSGIKKIGIANCIALKKEEEKLRKMLSDEFEVYSVDCYNGRISASDLLGIEAPGISCNPAGQADFLARNNTELNISLGLCMGHDMVFNQKSKAPVTTLVVKDRAHKHNPMESFNDNNLLTKTK